MKKVLFINAESVQTLCLARSLRNQGNYIIGFCSHMITSGYTSRWLNERYLTPEIKTHQAEFKEYVQRFLKVCQIDLIIPLADDGAEFLSRNKEEIESVFHTKCAIESFDRFCHANDKHLLMELCERYDVPHPVTKIINPDNMRLAAGYVGFPAMIKPDLSQGAKGIVKVTNMQDLEKKFLDIYNQFGACTLQRYVTQPDYYYNVMLYRNRLGETVGSTIIKIRRFFPLKGGSSCYCETVEYPVLLKECETVLERLEWRGFADFDVLEDKNSGELLVIEINPRVPSSIQAAYAAGVDFGKIFMADYFGDEMPIFNYKTGRQVRWMGLDFMWFLFSRDRFRFHPSWFRFFGEEVSYQDGSWCDPIPMLAGILSGVVKYLNPRFRKAKLNR